MLMMSNVLAGQNLPNVVWSLSYEMIFYLLLTALFMAQIHRRSNRYALAFGVAAVALGGLLPQAYFTDTMSSPRVIALVAGLVVLTGLAFAVALRGMPRLVGAALAAMVGLTLLAFNGTWLFPWEALSILALMFTGTMLYRAQQGQYPVAERHRHRGHRAGARHRGRLVAQPRLGHVRPGRTQLGALLVHVGLAGRPDVRDRAGVPERQMAGHPDLAGADQLLGVPAAPGAHPGLPSPGLDGPSSLLAAGPHGRLVLGHPDCGVLADLRSRRAAHAERRPPAGSLA
jgi:hypothetical protein